MGMSHDVQDIKIHLSALERKLEQKIDLLPRKQDIREVTDKLDDLLRKISNLEAHIERKLAKLG